MINLNTAINDNLSARELYKGEAECLPYIPAARYLIQKYLSEYWKHDCNDLDFVYLELSLCRDLLMETKCAISRKLKTKWIARRLNVNPLLLYNDANLPF